MNTDLETKVQYLKGVGPVKSKAFVNLGITTVYDLLTHYPRRYEDRSVVTKLSEAKVGETETISGILINVTEHNPRRGLKLLKALVNDGSGFLQITWFNQPFVKKNLKIGRRIFATGKVNYAYGGQGQFEMNPIIDYEVAEEQAEDTHKILPVYMATDALPQKFLRKLIEQVLDESIKIPENLPKHLQLEYQLMDRKDAMYKIHFPTTMEEMTKARYRLAFEELYLIQCGLLVLKKQSRDKQKGIRHLMNSTLLKKVLHKIPFKLTTDQKLVLEEIYHDMESSLPMRRLIQGDVGSGKTIVSVLALVKTIENGYQGALMAPTEILAEQHLASFTNLLDSCGIRIGFLSGKLTKKNREVTLEKIAAGEVDLVIGTHALIQEAVQFKNLGLVVTDEQHRFGIRQRALLEEKGQLMPDVLVMTATPIPRTMTLTVYGDLDVSVIKQLPPGRKPIRTFVRTSSKRDLIYQFVKAEIAKGRQAYVVCPLIEMSETLNVQSATEVYEELTGGIFRDIECGLVHGKLSSKEKEKIMLEFHAGTIKLLVATTVIEVGVNVPNASIMVIEGADRFGLAQLHQLRGRIGRGQYQSYCILISQGKSAVAKERLGIMEKTNSGFALAEEDLKLRGPGQFFGSMQHGLADLKIADVLNDLDILLKARDAALKTLASVDDLRYILEILSLQYKDQFMKITDN
ncbi:ATP-dependent DNA helicase RecG [Propionispira arboris]|uniref:ATP-dependent DNA helicase RecG n=1 Tax=Propionispira arboris TaxID=84035 RepID=A0A1H6VXG5_9FIRM|nr:ATP-dependent DNA helicase RecG [Propionispira arboris]SEJ09388.1 ATP-dependent DNA helicase RecG [Propionispira arboris]